MPKIDDWTYKGKPGTNNIDWVREEVGDIDEERKLVSDSTIQHHVDNEDNLFMAAYRVAKKIANRFAQYYDKSVNGLNERQSQISKRYEQLAADLLARSPHQIPTAVALRYSTRRQLTADTDLVPPPFHEGGLSIDRTGVEPGTSPVDTEPTET